jgi:P4 family phage/plasmid primase-like protien
MYNFLQHFPNSFIQTFDDVAVDGKKRGDKSLAQIFQFNEGRINKLQEKGAGAYFAINPTINNQRNIQSLKHISALGLDLDVAKERHNKNKQEILNLKSAVSDKLHELKTPPHFILTTKNGLQPIWLFESFTDYKDTKEANEFYKLVVKDLEGEIGHTSEGDSVIRVLRLPKTKHLKTFDKPFNIEVLEIIDPKEKYIFSDFLTQAQKQMVLPDPSEINEKKSAQPSSKAVKKSSKKSNGMNKSSLHKFFKGVAIRDVILKLSAESGQTIELVKNNDGSEQILENGEITSGFISSLGGFVYSSSGKSRKGNYIKIIEYYMNCSRDEALKWYSDKFLTEEDKKEFLDLTKTDLPDKMAQAFLKSNDLIEYQGKWFTYNEGIWIETDKKILEVDLIEFYCHEMEKYSRSRLSNTFDYLASRIASEFGAMIKKRLESNIVENHLIAINEGILNISDYTISPYQKKDCIFTKLPWDYKSTFDCPLWIDFLEQTLSTYPESDRKKIINLIQEWMGYTLIPNTSLEKFLILVGDGGNGKGVFLYIWQELLGMNNVSNIDLKDINSEQYTALLFGKLANICTDMQSSQQLDSGNFKTIVSGEPITAKSVYKEPFVFRPYARVILATNSMPFLKNSDNSIKRRMHLLRFNRKIEAHERDTMLKNKLEKELQEIFCWAIEGLKRLNKRRAFDEPSCMATDRDEFLKENDTVALWLEDLEITPGDLFCSRKDLYTSFKSFCQNNGKAVINSTKLYERLRSKYFIDSKQNGTRGFLLCNCDINISD